MTWRARRSYWLETIARIFIAGKTGGNKSENRIGPCRSGFFIEKKCYKLQERREDFCREPYRRNHVIAISDKLTKKKNNDSRYLSSNTIVYRQCCARIYENIKRQTIRIKYDTTIILFLYLQTMDEIIWTPCDIATYCCVFAVLYNFFYKMT